MRVQLIYAPLPRDDYSFYDEDTYRDGDPKGIGSNPLIAHFDFTVQTEAGGLTAALIQLDQLMAYAEQLMKRTPIINDEMPASNSLGSAPHDRGRGSRPDGSGAHHPIGPNPTNPSWSEPLIEAALREMGWRP